MIELIKAKLKEDILAETGLDCDIEEPKKGNYDLAIPLFKFLKQKKYKLPELYEILQPVILKNDMILETKLIGAFLNMKLKSAKFSEIALTEIYKKKDKFGSKKPNGKVVVIDYSSPNIAKKFSIGHLRSTVIGNSLKFIYEKIGYKVVGINLLGDWGTQFGKLIVAYKKWGDEKALEKEPISELQRIYVKFHEEALKDPSLEELGRKAFKAIEDGDKETIELWNYFKKESLKEFDYVYNLLDVDFDLIDGEAFYNDKMPAVIDLLESKDLLKIDDGATIIDLGDDIPPALIKRSDGATLYLTRDIAALLYRIERFGADKAFYVVGSEQKLHFEQLKRIAKLLDLDVEIEHINFGLVLTGGKKMSTRSGTNAGLNEILNQAILEAKAQILEKNPDLKNIDEAAKAIGVGAIIFNDLKNERHLNVDFNLSQMLKFEGQTGPYVQYSSVRINSILKENKLNLNKVDFDVYKDDLYFTLVKLTAQFDEVVVRAAEENNPSVISKYLLNLSQEFNRFYGKQKIVVKNEGTLHANLLLISNIRTVLNEGLRLLGIKYLNEM